MNIPQVPQQEIAAQEASLFALCMLLARLMWTREILSDLFGTGMHCHEMSIQIFAILEFLATGDPLAQELRIVTAFMSRQLVPLLEGPGRYALITEVGPRARTWT